MATGFTALFVALASREGLHEATAEVIWLLVLFAVIVVSVAVAWWNAALGAFALITVGLALAVFALLTADRKPGGGGAVGEPLYPLGGADLVRRRQARAGVRG